MFLLLPAVCVRAVAGASVALSAGRVMFLQHVLLSHGLIFPSKHQSSAEMRNARRLFRAEVPKSSWGPWVSCQGAVQAGTPALGAAVFLLPLAEFGPAVSRKGVVRPRSPPAAGQLLAKLRNVSLGGEGQAFSAGIPSAVWAGWEGRKQKGIWP